MRLYMASMMQVRTGDIFSMVNAEKWFSKLLCAYPLHILCGVGDPSAGVDCEGAGNPLVSRFGCIHIFVVLRYFLARRLRSVVEFL